MIHGEDPDLWTRPYAMHNACCIPSSEVATLDADRKADIPASQ